jgi:TonB-dependent receptor
MLFMHYKANKILLPFKFLIQLKPWCLSLLLCCTIYNLQAQEKFSALTTKVDYSSAAVSAAELLTSIQKQTDYTFSIDRAVLNSITIRDVHFTKISLGKALQYLEEHYDLAFSVAGKNIAVRKVAAVRTALPQKPAPTAGMLKGRVVDFENAQPLPGATVKLEGTSKVAISDEKGYYNINSIQAGKYTLTVTYTGYAATHQMIRVEEGNNTVDVKLQVKPATANTVVVTAIKRKRVANTTDAQLIRELYNARSVVSGISSEQIARTLDRDAAEVVKRVPGVNISEDNFVIVRGLSKRYNLTYLNDAVAPANDADSRSFSYDVISSNAIDRIMVYKSPTPDLPGEFSGGLVKIYTKKSQMTRQLDLQLSTQYRSGSTFDNVWSYAGSKYDFLGFDDGTRKLPSGIPRAANFNHLTPAENALYSKQFKNIYVLDKTYKALPDLRLNLNYYDAWKTGRKYLKNLSSLSYSNTHEQRISEQRSLYKFYDGRLTQGIHAARISVIQDNEMQVNGRLTLALHNFLNVNNQRIAVEDYRKLDDYPGQEFRHTNLYYVQNTLYSGQLAGTYSFGKHKRNELKANAGYSTIHKQEPDNRDYTLNRPVAATGERPWILGTELISFYTLSRSFNDITEKSYQGNMDLNYRISDVWGFKAGAYYQSRMRDFNNRIFIIVNGVNLYDPNLAIRGSKYDGDNGPVEGNGNPISEKYLQHYFEPSMFRADGTGYRWLEKTTPNNQYYADNTLKAGYISSDINLLQDRINISGGLRIEDNRFRILGSYENGLAAYPLIVDQPLSSVLPSLNASFKADSSLIIRVGYGKTLNRPEFREAAPMQYINYLDQETYNGNPDLRTVNIHNTELRLEWYPHGAHSNELINIGFFYKQLDRPIERFRMIFNEGFDQFVYVNTGKARVYGIEAELRKNLDFISGNFFRNLSVVLNGSWFKSNVNVPSMPQYVGYDGARSRPMQGQSPYLINAAFNYENPGLGTKISATYNRAADYIYAVGANRGKRADTDIMMKARDQLDLIWRQRINKTWGISAGIQNILNTPVLLYQDWKHNYHYDKLKGAAPEPGQATLFEDADIIYRRYYQHPYYSFALNIIL